MPFLARSGRSFEELPPEILLLILENLITPSYIFSLIRASPVAYRTFRSKKVVVLANAIRRSIHPAVLPLAITVCDAASDFSFSKCSMAWETAKKECRNPDYAYFVSWLHKFYKYVYRITSASGDEIRLNLKAADTRYDVHLRLQDLSLVLSLCRLWSTTEFFIRDFPFSNFRARHPNEVTNRRSNADSSLSGLSGSADLGLRESEYGRLQRGFFHFELHRQLFGALHRHLFSGLYRHKCFCKSRENFRLPQYHMFNSCMAQTERSELYLIQAHLSKRMQFELNSVYGYMISEIKGSSWRKYRFLPNLFTPKPNMRGKIFKQLDLMEIILSELGLPFIQKFIKMGCEEQLAVVVLCASQRRKPKPESHWGGYDCHHLTIAKSTKYSFVHQLQLRHHESLMLELSLEGRSVNFYQPLDSRCLGELFGFLFWDDARSGSLLTRDYEIMLVETGWLDLNLYKISTTKSLARLRAGVADWRATVPDLVFEMPDLSRLIESLEY